MAEPKFIPPTFQGQPSSIATYDYYDIEEGTGVKVFYIGTGTDKNLVRGTAFYSNDIKTSAVPTTATTEADLDFDITFNKQKTLKGQALVTIPIALEGENTNNGVSANVIVNIIHYDGTTETNIGTNTSDTQIYDGQGVTDKIERVFAVEVDLTEKHFKAGETLRINLQYYCVAAQASTYMHIGHDPKNRTTDMQYTGNEMTTTICEAHIPFRLDELGL